MDNKKTGIIAAVVVVVVLLGGGIWYMMSAQNAAKVAQNINNGQSQATGGTGTMYLGITDAAAKMGNVTSVELTIDKVEAFSNAQGWIALSQTPQTFSLLALKASNTTQLLAKIDVPADTYRTVRLHVTKVLVTVSGQVKEARLPSNWLTITTNVKVADQASSVAKFDILADKSLHMTGKGEIIFAPVVKFNSTSTATVNVDSNNAVTQSGGNEDTNNTSGMDVNGSVRQDFEIDQNATLQIKNGGIEMEGQPQVKVSCDPIPAGLTVSIVNNICVYTPVSSPIGSEGPLSISSMSPNSGAIGTAVTLTGRGFTATGNNIHVDRGGIANVSSINGTTLSFTFPSGVSTCDFVPEVDCSGTTKLLGAGTYAVMVTNANGTSNQVMFTVTGSGNGNNASNGTVSGSVTIASDCDVSACSHVDLSSLGLLFRQGTTTVGTIKFNTGSSYNVSLPAGRYYVYEDSNNWTGSGLTASIAGSAITINANSTTTLNVVIDNLKPNLPQ